MTCHASLGRTAFRAKLALDEREEPLLCRFTVECTPGNHGGMTPAETQEHEPRVEQPTPVEGPGELLLHSGGRERNLVLVEPEGIRFVELAT